ncbi:MAG: lysophospholipid acyltransferase family protein [Thermonemataceae bacterium]|nr:lysophospholipid acyltransferase family protein [Thermonemataceae bacterium]
MFFLKIIAKFLLWITGWKIAGKLPETKKTVMIAAPHTSNWDFFYAMSIFSALGIRVRFLGKKSLFKFPLGLLMRFFGGIPVDRSKSNNFVSAAAKMIRESQEELIILVPAEGTRGYTENWKSGFYYIAQEAGVPISLGFLDYAKKEGGFFPDMFYPTGNYVEDLEKIQLIYKDVQGKYPQNSALYKKFGNKIMLW